jgi:hypothetical protein
MVHISTGRLALVLDALAPPQRAPSSFKAAARVHARLLIQFYANFSGYPRRTFAT